jgi:DNA polymerase III subunit delta'
MFPTVDHILGQQRALDTLQSAVRSGRLHHAWIFHGPAGVGKFTTAAAFARVLLCPDARRDMSGQVAACGRCESCRLAEAGTHPDLHVVVKELARFSEDRSTRDRKLTQLPVDVLRTALLEPVTRTAAMRHGKVFIVDEAELINETGQNLLLKTLEEPPADTYLILVTSREPLLLATIRSRCQRVAFGPLGDDVVEQWLADRTQDLSAAHRRAVAHFAAGSLGAAELAVAYGLHQWADDLNAALDAMIAGRFPIDLGVAMAEKIDAFAAAWVERHQNASKDAANRQAAGMLLGLLASLLRQRLAAAAQEVGGGGDPIDAEAALEPYADAIAALPLAEAELGANVNVSLVCDHLASLLNRRLGPLARRRGARPVTRGAV